MQETLIKSANDAFEIGFLGKTKPDLGDIFDVNILNEVLQENGLQSVGEVKNQTTTTGNGTSTAVTTNLRDDHAYIDAVYGGSDAQ